VLTVHADAITAQGKASAGVDLALGLLLLVAGGLLATGRLHGRQRAPVPAGAGPQEKPEKKEKKDGWAQRVLAEPRLKLAMLVGALVGLPGASYIAALHNLSSFRVRRRCCHRSRHPGRFDLGRAGLGGWRKFGL